VYGAYDNVTETENEYGEYDVTHQYGENIMITLDFAGLHEQKCQGSDKPGQDTSDYELWSPHDDGRHGAKDGCLLGQKVTYTRRKQDNECFNGDDHETVRTRSYCPCTEADYECDMNFVRNRAGQCEHIPDPLNPDSTKVNPDKDADCAAEGFWFENQGYRKIPGDQCRGGAALDPIKHECGGIVSGVEESVGFIAHLLTFKKLFYYAIIAACVYYGWPIIEAIYIILPIPDNFGDTLSGIWSTIISIPVLGEILNLISSFVMVFFGNGGSNNSRSSVPAGYAQADKTGNIESQPDGFMNDEDDSDEDIGKQNANQNDIVLNADSDEGNDDDLINTMSTELADFGTDDTNKAASNIPKLSGPK